MDQYEKIERLAYEIYEKGARNAASKPDNWLGAERRLREWEKTRKKPDKTVKRKAVLKNVHR